MINKKKFFWVLLFFTSLILSDKLLGWAFKNLYFSMRSGDRFAITYSLDSTQADLLIFGTSRARHHYVPKIFEENLNTTCYNTGRDGEGISYNYILLSAICKRYKPKFVILDFDTESFYKNSGNDELNSLLPYCKLDTVIERLVNERRENEIIKQFSSLYNFNSTLLSSISGQRKQSMTEKLNSGFDPLKGEMSLAAKVETSDLDFQKIDDKKIDDFGNFIKCCKYYRILLVLVQSPRYSKFKNNKAQLLADSIIKVYNIPYFNYKEDSSFLNRPTLFKDAAHLNIEGAKLFSIKLAGELSNIF